MFFDDNNNNIVIKDGCMVIVFFLFNLSVVEKLGFEFLPLPPPGGRFMRDNAKLGGGGWMVG